MKLPGKSGVLSANVSETITVQDVGSPKKPVRGLIAILDALGAATSHRLKSKNSLNPANS